MSEYKRLTKKDGFTKNLDLTQELGYSYIYNRLAELENKIENGTLVELPCSLGEHFVISDYGFNRFKVEKVKIIGFNFSTYDKTIYPVDEYETYYTPDKVFDAEESAEARLKELLEERK